MTTRRDRLLLEDTINWDELEKSYARVTDKKTFSSILFRIAPEPSVPDHIFQHVAEQVTQETASFRDRSSYKKFPTMDSWVVKAVYNAICGIWATYLTQVPMRFLHERDRSYPQFRYGVLSVSRDKEVELDSIASLEDLRTNHPEVYKCWERTKILLNGIIGYYYKFVLLHALVQWGYPNWMIWFVAKLYPDHLQQAYSRSTDDDQAYRGLLPIHYCGWTKTKTFCVDDDRYPISFSNAFERDHPDLFRPTSVYLLSKLCGVLKPSAIGSFNSSSRNVRIVLKGKLPLHTYLEYGPQSRNDGKYDFDDVKKLVEIAPDSLVWKSVALQRTYQKTDDYSNASYRDDKNWKYEVIYEYPFMIAASSDKSRWRDDYYYNYTQSRVGESKEEMQYRQQQRLQWSSSPKEQLTAIYWLLRQDPSALQNACLAGGDYPSTQQDIDVEVAKSEYLNRRTVAKYFDHKEKRGYEELFIGEVADIISGGNTGMIFRIRYDGGIEEDMDFEEFEACKSLYSESSWLSSSVPKIRCKEPLPTTMVAADKRTSETAAKTKGKTKTTTMKKQRKAAPATTKLRRRGTRKKKFKLATGKAKNDSDYETEESNDDGSDEDYVDDDEGDSDYEE